MRSRGRRRSKTEHAPCRHPWRLLAGSSEPRLFECGWPLRPAQQVQEVAEAESEAGGDLGSPSGGSVARLSSASSSLSRASPGAPGSPTAGARDAEPVPLPPPASNGAVARPPASCDAKLAVAVAEGEGAAEGAHPGIQGRKLDTALAWAAGQGGSGSQEAPAFRRQLTRSATQAATTWRRLQAQWGRRWAFGQGGEGRGWAPGLAALQLA